MAPTSRIGNDERRIAHDPVLAVHDLAELGEGLKAVLRACLAEDGPGPVRELGLLLRRRGPECLEGLLRRDP